jgi:hypothetical protein
MRRKKTAPKPRKPKLTILGIQHKRIRIKKGTPVSSRSWTTFGVLPEHHCGTATGVVSTQVASMQGIEGFLRVKWDGHKDISALVNPIHVEEIT